ncbi:hypothetical protein ACFWU5_16135 [Nocardia sp. NPDC058640]|uniref:hypothetical protein n=1 Tax=Nocardia sp. NPDC058640 TaxID=3346571 RepID=UPI0036597C9B
MSFLIRRNLPRAWAGWSDSFQRPPQNPLQHPWKHLGGGESFINALEELVCTQQIVNDDGRGPSYEWMPFTPNWGFEANIYYPVEGIDNQIFMMGFTNTWVNVAATFQNVFGVWLYHELGGGDYIQTGEVPSMWSPIQNRRSWPAPGGNFIGRDLNIRIWIENDEYARIWLNNTYVGSSMISPGWKLGPGRRCMRFMNRSYCNTYVRHVNHYDRPGTVPPKSVWSTVFYDDFNRADGAADNGWTQLGTDAGIVSNRYTHTGTNNNSVGLIRNVGNLDGRARIECVVRNPSGVDGSLMLFCNAAGDQALVANVFNNHVYLARMTSSVNGTPGFFDFQDGGVAIADGDTLTFTVYDEMSWLEVNGIPKLYAGNVHNVVPHTNAYAGLRVRRNGSDSVKFDDVRIYSGIGI